MKIVVKLIPSSLVQLVASCNSFFCFICLGLIVGAIIRYAGGDSSVSHLSVVAAPGTTYNNSVPPDALWFSMRAPSNPAQNKTYAFVFRGEVVDAENNEIDQKVLNVLLIFVCVCI